MPKIKSLFYIGLFFCVLTINAQNTSLNNKFRLAQSYEQANIFDKAKNIYLELYNTEPSNYSYFDGLNRCYINLKEYDNSAKIIEEMLTKNQNDINLSGLLGSTYYLMNKQDEAVKIWKEALTKQGDNINAYRIIANYALQNRAFDEAINVLQKGSDISSDKTSFALELANLYSITMKYGEATKQFCNILLKQPNQVSIIKGRISSYLMQFEAFAQSIKVINEYIDDNEDNPVFYDLAAYVYQQNDDYKSAYQNVLIWDKLSNSNGSQIFTFAQSALDESQFEYAVIGYNTIINNYSTTPFVGAAKLGYARALLLELDYKYHNNNNNWKEFSDIDTTGAAEYSKVINTYVEIMNEFKAEQEINNEAMFNIGNIYKNRLNNKDSAIKYFTELTNKYPYTNYAGKAFFELADIEIQNDNLQKAKEYLNKIKIFKRVSSDELKQTDLLLAKITFWQGDIENCTKQLGDITKDLNENAANDAISLLVTINALRSDSLLLLKYAQAEMFANQKKFKAAADIYVELSKNEDLFFLKDLSLYSYAKMSIAINDYATSVKILENLSNNENMNIFADKSLYLLANLYYFGLSDKDNAKICFQRLLEKFPNSLLVDKSRNFLINYK